MAPSNPIRVLVIHDDPVVRVGLASAFARYADLEVVGANSAADDMSIRLEPSWARTADVVVTDYDHGMQLASLAPGRGGQACRIVIVAAHSREWEIRSALERGVRGYVLVGSALDELAAGVRSVYRGIRYLSPQVAQRLAEILTGDPLTAREQDVLRLVVEGMGNKAIARRLCIAVGTVKSHLKGIFDKLSVGSRTQAICAAERRGLLCDGADRERDGAAGVADRHAVASSASRLAGRALVTPMA